MPPTDDDVRQTQVGKQALSRISAGDMCRAAPGKTALSRAVGPTGIVFHVSCARFHQHGGASHTLLEQPHSRRITRAFDALSRARTTFKWFFEYGRE